MATEIERKFLVKDDSWRDGAEGEFFRQGYCRGGSATIRVRVAGAQGFITIKGPVSGCSRSEFEYAIPVNEAEELLEMVCSAPYISKVRYRREYRGKSWEVDVFDGDNAGLVLAEIELTDENEEFSLPPWVGAEVTGDFRYYNSNLATYPFKDWN